MGNCAKYDREQKEKTLGDLQVVQCKPYKGFPNEAPIGLITEAFYVVG